MHVTVALEQVFKSVVIELYFENLVKYGQEVQHVQKNRNKTELDISLRL